METVKPQPTLRGFTAWALLRLVEARGVSLAEGAAWVLERWFDEQDEYLERKYGITIDEFKKDADRAKRQREPSGDEG